MRLVHSIAHILIIKHLDEEEVCEFYYDDMIWQTKNFQKSNIRARPLFTSGNFSTFCKDWDEVINPKIMNNKFAAFLLVMVN